MRSFKDNSQYNVYWMNNNGSMLFCEGHKWAPNYSFDFINNIMYYWKLESFTGAKIVPIMELL
jgi:hypothetical protein